MANNDKFEVEGTVIDVLRGGNFKVELDDNKMQVTCVLSGKLRMNKIHVLLGDKVIVSVSPYDLTRGIITWRLK